MVGGWTSRLCTEPLGMFKVLAIYNTLAWVSFCAQGPRSKRNVAPYPCTFAVFEAIPAITHILKWNILHENARLEQAGLRVLKSPKLWMEVLNNFQRLQHQGVSRNQVSWTSGSSCYAVVLTHGTCPNDVKMTRSELVVVPRQNVCADGRTGFWVGVQADDFCANCLKRFSD